MTVFLEPHASQEIRAVKSKRIRKQWAKIFRTYAAIFSELGVPDPETEVIYFRSLTTGIVAEFIMEPRGYPLVAMKAHVLQKYQPKKGKRRVVCRSLNA
jgi:hypothetical protein